MWDKLKEILPIKITDEILKISSQNIRIEEIRIRLNRQAYLITSQGILFLSAKVSVEDIQSILNIITKGSLYAYRDTLVCGYISLDFGIRVGVIGRASIENGEIVGIYDISEFAFRIPNPIEVDCSDIYTYATKYSLLIYSPPGVGKTTLLRALITKLSIGKNAKRLALIDTRNELGIAVTDEKALVSVLSSYPRDIGIEIAIRTMNPQIIICDEIGDMKDASAIIDTQAAGVSIIASCHARSIAELFSHRSIENLHKNGIFDYYIGIERGNNNDFIYSITSRKEGDKYYKDYRCNMHSTVGLDS